MHERNNVTDGVADPLPLDLLDSSHYHALLIQDLTGNDSNSWRDPVLLTKDFLFNTVQSRDISQRHALSGVVVRKERLNVHISSKHRDKPFASDTKRSILQRTAWDTTILVVPFFLLSNSLPFLISVRTWQHSKDNDDDLWKEPAQYDDTNEENLSSDDDDTSSMTPSLRGKSKNSDQFHLPKETDQRSQFAVAQVAEGGYKDIHVVRNCWNGFFLLLCFFSFCNYWKRRYTSFEWY